MHTGTSSSSHSPPLPDSGPSPSFYPAGPPLAPLASCPAAFLPYARPVSPLPPQLPPCSALSGVSWEDHKSHGTQRPETQGPELEPLSVIDLLGELRKVVTLLWTPSIFHLFFIFILFYFCCCISSLYISDVNAFIRYMTCKYFLSFSRLVFHSDDWLPLMCRSFLV